MSYLRDRPILTPIPLWQRDLLKKMRGLTIATAKIGTVRKPIKSKPRPIDLSKTSSKRQADFEHYGNMECPNKYLFKIQPDPKTNVVERPQSPGAAFRILDLPRELRDMIWQFANPPRPKCACEGLFWHKRGGMSDHLPYLQSSWRLAHNHDLVYVYGEVGIGLPINRQILKESRYVAIPAGWEVCSEVCFRNLSKVITSSLMHRFSDRDPKYPLHLHLQRLVVPSNAFSRWIPIDLHDPQLRWLMRRYERLDNLLFIAHRPAIKDGYLILETDSAGLDRYRADYQALAIPRQVRRERSALMSAMSRNHFIAYEQNEWARDLARLPIFQAMQAITDANMIEGTLFTAPNVFRITREWNRLEAQWFFRIRYGHVPNRGRKRKLGQYSDAGIGAGPDHDAHQWIMDAGFKLLNARFIDKFEQRFPQLSSDALVKSNSAA